MAQSQTLLELEDVWKVYRMGSVDVPALQGITLKIDKGEFVAVIGQSGSGKSTLMNLIGCLDIPTKGEVKLKSKDIAKLHESDLAKLRGRTIGFIFQQYNLIQNITAFENVILPLELAEIDEKQAIERARHVLTIVGLADKMHHLPSQLSGGQQQRVSIARSLVNNPEIILADEPTGALDTQTGKEVLETLKKLWKEQQKTIIMVTHDLGLAKNAKKRIELRDGKIISVTKEEK